jgi:hypothetical protein
MHQKNLGKVTVSSIDNCLADVPNELTIIHNKLYSQNIIAFNERKAIALCGIFSTTNVTLDPIIFVLPECNRYLKLTASETLPIIISLSRQKFTSHPFSKLSNLSKILRFFSKRGVTEIFRSSATKTDSGTVPDIPQNRRFHVAENSVHERMSLRTRDL